MNIVYIFVNLMSGVQTRACRMKRGNRFRLYPTTEQARQIDRIIGQCRYVWNWYLGLRYLGFSAYNFRKIEDKGQLEKLVGKTIKSVPKKIWAKIKDLTLDEQVEQLREDRSDPIRLACAAWSQRDADNLPQKVSEVVDCFLTDLGLPTDLSGKEISKMLSSLKDERPWLQAAPAQALVNAVRTAEDTFQKAFKGEVGWPKFKRKGYRGSFSNQNNKRRVRKDGSLSPLQNRIRTTSKNMGLLTVPKIQDVKIRLHRDIEGEIGTITISRTPSGKYYAAFPSETKSDGNELELFAQTHKKVSIESSRGLDFGLEHFVCLDDGSIIPPFYKENPHIERLEGRKIALQRKLQNKRGRNDDWQHSNRYHRVRKMLARVEEKLAFCRKDHQHKITHKLVKNEDTALLGIENLNVSGMLKNRRLAKAISKAGWRSLRTMLEYKAARNGVEVVDVDRFYPSSKTCSACGHIKSDLKLSDREWTCESCGVKHDRDQNAAINIKNKAFEIYQSRT